MTWGSRRILIADDDPASCELVTFFLKSLGYRVAAVPDGNRALNVGLDSDIGLVILDAHLPVYTGFEVIGLLRTRHLIRPLKFLALTGDESDEIRESFERVGVDGFLLKPVDLDELRGEVDRLMAGVPRRDLGLYRRHLKRQLGLAVT